MLDRTMILLVDLTAKKKIITTMNFLVYRTSILLVDLIVKKIITTMSFLVYRTSTLLVDLIVKKIITKMKFLLYRTSILLVDRIHNGYVILHDRKRVEYIYFLTFNIGLYYPFRSVNRSFGRNFRRTRIDSVHQRFLLK